MGRKLGQGLPGGSKEVGLAGGDVHEVGEQDRQLVPRRQSEVAHAPAREPLEGHRGRALAAVDTGVGAAHAYRDPGRQHRQLRAEGLRRGPEAIARAREQGEHDGRRQPFGQVRAQRGGLGRRDRLHPRLLIR
ncbi:MAG TPA: hypothetical protein VGN09_13580 [Vicinamibacteria bacterium]|jgi:hypothetical protein